MPEAASIYPSRYEEYEKVLNERLAEAARVVVAQARDGRNSIGVWERPPVRGIAAGTVALGCFLYLMGGRGETQSRLPTGNGTIFSAQLAGAGVAAADFVLPVPAPEPAPALPPGPAPDRWVADAPTERAHVAATLPGGRRRRAAVEPQAPQPHSTPCPTCGERPEATEVLFDENGDFGTNVPAAVASSPLTLNVGTRIRALLSEPAITSAGGAPVAATLLEDIVVGDRVALPAGSRLVGDALAVEEDDRLQLVFSAVVRNGQTVPLSGIALGADNRAGLPATVLRKGSTGKRGLGRALGILGSTLSLGLLPKQTGLAAEVAGQASSAAARDLSQVEYRWTRSDKVLRAPAGPVTVYLRSDLVLP